MLLALWPLLFQRNSAHRGGTYVDPDVTHRAIRAPEVIQKTAAMVAAEAHIQQRLHEQQNVSDTDARIADEVVGIPILPISNPVRVFGNDARKQEPATSIIAVRNTLPSGLNEAVRNQREDDDEAILLLMLAI